MATVKGKRLPTVMGKRWHEVPQAKIPRSSFNRDHAHKTTFNVGLLVPIFVDEALPGDTLNLQMNAFARLTTPIKPFMDNLYMDTFFFAVPYRLVWDNWQRFMGEQTNPGDSTDYTVPLATVPVGGYDSLSLEDYMGLPVGVDGFVHTSVHNRAYTLIWNEWFRDQNLQNSGSMSTGDGPDVIGVGGSTLRRRGKRHDYFTSCLPWPQKGDAVSLPLANTSVIPDPGGSGYPTWTHDNPAYTGNLQYKTAATTTDVQIQGTGNAPQAGKPLLWENTGLVVDAAQTTINALREAFQIQKLLERDARGGTRYIEIIKSHFGVTSADQRLQRPEYLGGGSSPVVISPIAQTSASDTQPTEQGNLAAMGTVSIDSGHGFVKSFTEHCMVIGLVSVRADLTYQQGLDRMWSRQTRYDFFWPAFQGLGEQAVLNKEIYCDGSANDDLAFGYQERYAEYRYKPSKITGLFRSNVSGGPPYTTLHVWHLSQDFGNLPVLGDTFIQDNPPVSRVVAVQTEPQFYFDSYFRYRCVRPMPVYGIPGLIDHF